jgi:hypothetical protein
MEPVIPDFAGKVVEIVKVDSAFFLWTADNWEIRLAGPVAVSGGGAPPVEIDIEGPGGSLPAELDGVAGSTITQLLVAEGGSLIIRLGDRQLSARAAEDYEAWQIAGHDGELLICTPGGGLTYFPPVPGIGTPAGTGSPSPDGAPS